MRLKPLWGLLLAICLGRGAGKYFLRKGLAISEEMAYAIYKVFLLLPDSDPVFITGESPAQTAFNGCGYWFERAGSGMRHSCGCRRLRRRAKRLKFEV